MKNKDVPKYLRLWFLIHFIIDMLFAIPLIFFPKFILEFFNFQGQTALARLVGAALIGIGGMSFFSYKSDRECYKSMLTLKIIWSGAAITGLLCSVFAGESIKLWYLIGIFFIFFLVWVYYKVKLEYKKF